MNYFRWFYILHHLILNPNGRVKFIDWLTEKMNPFWMLQSTLWAQKWPFIETKIGILWKTRPWQLLLPSISSHIWPWLQHIVPQMISKEKQLTLHPTIDKKQPKVAILCKNSVLQLKLTDIQSYIEPSMSYRVRWLTIYKVNNFFNCLGHAMGRNMTEIWNESSFLWKKSVTVAFAPHDISNWAPIVS